MMETLIAATAICYAGCNTGAPDGQTMNVLECDTESGAVRVVQTIRGVQGTSYFQIDAAGKTLYSVIGEKRDTSVHGRAVAFPICSDGKLGEMRALADLPCETPCHVALSPDGSQFAFAAYTSATCGTMPIGGGDVHFAVHPNEGMGPRKDRQQKAFAHCAFYTPDGKRIGIVDLGTDRILFYDPATMTPDTSMTILADPGDGPRHVVWSKDNRFLFVVNELGNSVLSFAFDGKSFTRVGKWSMLPDGFKDFSKAAAIKLTADGKVLMASNRGHDSIAIFSVDTATGMLTRRNVAKLTGEFPRDFELMPGEKFMIVGHKMSNEIRAYRFDRENFTLTPSGEPIAAWRPLCFKFAPTAVR